MNICEGCIKQDVCKFRENVTGFEENIKGEKMFTFDEPLEVTCKYKEVDDWDDGDECPDNPVPCPYPPYTPTWPNYYPPYPNYYHPTCTDCDTTTTCGKEW